MDRNELIGNWNIAKGKIKVTWSEMTGNKLLNVEGQKDQRIGAVQRKFGVSKERAEKYFSRSNELTS